LGTGNEDAVSIPPFRDFAVVQLDLEDTVTQLKENLSREERTALLRKLRRLLEEADSIATADAQ
jgi:hypothetical protein